MNIKAKKLDACPFCGSPNLIQNSLGFLCKNCGFSGAIFEAVDENSNDKQEDRPFTKKEKEMYEALCNAMDTLRCAGYGYTEDCLDEADKILELLRRLDFEPDE